MRFSYPCGSYIAHFHLPHSDCDAALSNALRIQVKAFIPCCAFTFRTILNCVRWSNKLKPMKKNGHAQTYGCTESSFTALTSQSHHVQIIIEQSRSFISVNISEMEYNELLSHYWCCCWCCCSIYYYTSNGTHVKNHCTNYCDSLWQRNSFDANSWEYPKSIDFG